MRSPWLRRPLPIVFSSVPPRFRTAALVYPRLRSPASGTPWVYFRSPMGACESARMRLAGEEVELIMRTDLSGLQRHLLAFVACLGLCGFGNAAFAGGASVTVRAGGSPACTRVILLGTGGGPVARRLRSQPANLLIVDGRPYLIDAGEGVVRQLAWGGYQPPQIRTIFITH